MHQLLDIHKVVSSAIGRAQLGCSLTLARPVLCIDSSIRLPCMVLLSREWLNSTSADRQAKMVHWDRVAAHVSQAVRPSGMLSGRKFF